MKDYDESIRKRTNTEHERLRYSQQLAGTKKRAREVFDELAELTEEIDSVKVCSETAMKISKLSSDFVTLVKSMARIYNTVIRRYSEAEWTAIRQGAKSLEIESEK